MLAVTALVLLGVAEAGSPIASGLDAIVRDDPSFDAKHFVAGARQAYEMIVIAYAEGDRRSLKNLLAREVYDGFDSAIRERENKGETAESRFVSIDKADITAAEMRGRSAHVTVHFVSQLVSIVRDRGGAVIEGSPDKVTDVNDGKSAFEALAADCAADGVWEFFFVSPGLKVTGAVGTPLSPVAIK